jgi:hypothetical protein
VRRYHTNYLMGRSPLSERRSFSHTPLQSVSLCGISRAFAPLSRSLRQVSYVFLTRAPLCRSTVRLACVRHAASVHPEPGSNSPYSCRVAYATSGVCLACSVFTVVLLRCSPTSVGVVTFGYLWHFAETPAHFFKSFNLFCGVDMSISNPSLTGQDLFS